MKSYEAWQTNNISAFESLFYQYQGLVYKTAYLMIGDKREAEDILQEVFVAVWKSRSTFNPDKGKLSTWLHRITINQCISKNRRKKRNCQSLEKLREEGDDSLEIRSAALPEELSINRMEYEEVLKAVDSMDGKHRPVLVLRYFNELSYREISEVLNIPLGTVKSRLNQAVKILRTQVSVQQKEEEKKEVEL